MKTINEMINSLTLEEKELFKDLIEECQEREKEIIKSEEEASELTKTLFSKLTSIFSSLSQTKEEMDVLNVEMKSIVNLLNQSDKQIFN